MAARQIHSSPGDSAHIQVVLVLGTVEMKAFIVAHGASGVADTAQASVSFQSQSPTSRSDVIEAEADRVPS